MKVFPFKIPKPLHEKLIVQVDHVDQFYNKLHQHEEIQISYVKHGKGKLIVADSVHPFENHDIFVIGSNIPHLFQSIDGSRDAQMISLFFTVDTFGEDFFKIPELQEITGFFYTSKVGFKVESNKRRIIQIMERLPKASKFSRFILALKLMKKLGDSETKTLTKFIYPHKISYNEGQRMLVVFDYAVNNFQKNVTLEEVSKLAFMTPNAFCRFFKQRTNKTFFQFLIELRVEHACQLLMEDSGGSMDEVAYGAGFQSVSNFNRKFKELKGMAPSQFSKKLHSKDKPLKIQVP